MDLSTSERQTQMFKSILVPIDVAHKSSWQTAIPEAVEKAKAAHGKLAVLTVVREMTAILGGVRSRLQLQSLMDEARGQLSAIVREYRTDGLKIAEEVRFGSIGHEILAAATNRRINLIIMASHRPEMLDYLIGPNAAHVAVHAKCSVLILRKNVQRKQR
jgi:nucleotide-binding universal stress UspA family protein